MGLRPPRFFTAERRATGGGGDCSHRSYRVGACLMSARRISRGRQIRGSGDESPPAGSRGGAPVGSRGEAPRRRRKIVKQLLNNNWYIERFTVITSAQNTSQHFQGEGGGQMPPCPCLRALMACL